MNRKERKALRKVRKFILCGPCDSIAALAVEKINRKEHKDFRKIRKFILCGPCDSIAALAVERINRKERKDFRKVRKKKRWLYAFFANIASP